MPSKRETSAPKDSSTSERGSTSCPHFGPSHRKRKTTSVRRRTTSEKSGTTSQSEEASSGKEERTPSSGWTSSESSGAFAKKGQTSPDRNPRSSDRFRPSSHRFRPLSRRTRAPTEAGAPSFPPAALYAVDSPTRSNPRKAYLNAVGDTFGNNELRAHARGRVVTRRAGVHGRRARPTTQTN